MGTFVQHAADVRAAPDSELVPPTAFSLEWDGRPVDAVCIGVRPLSEGDIDYVRGESEKRARSLHDDIELATDAYNDTLMRLTVARGSCDPNDARKPHPVWRGMPDDMVYPALTPAGTKLIFDAVERVTIATSPTRREITIEELPELLQKAPHALDALPDWHARRIRRLLAYCLDEIVDALEPAPEAGATVATIVEDDD